MSALSHLFSSLKWESCLFVISRKWKICPSERGLFCIVDSQQIQDFHKEYVQTIMCLLQLLHNGQARPGSTCDQRHTWQETHVTASASMDHDLAFRRRRAKYKQSQESSISQEKQLITIDTDKKRPIRHPEQKGVNRTQKKYSVINTAEYGSKREIFLTWRLLCGSTENYEQ